MPDLLDAIRERRSIRKYQAKEVPKQLVEDVLAAAGWAPSAHNAQPWRFLVISKQSIKRELALAMSEAWVKDLTGDGMTIDEGLRKSRVERFTNAPVLILACLSMEGMQKFRDHRRQIVEHDLAVQSLGAAIENMLLAAHTSGLGGCWFCAPAFCKDTLRKVLKIPADIEPHALIILGFPAEKPIAPPKKALDDFCFWDTWGNG